VENVNLLETDEFFNSLSSDRNTQFSAKNILIGLERLNDQSKKFSVETLIT